MVSADRVTRRVNKVRNALKHLLDLSTNDDSVTPGHLISEIIDDQFIEWFNQKHPGQLKGIVTVLLTKHLASFISCARKEGINITPSTISQSFARLSVSSSQETPALSSSLLPDVHEPHEQSALPPPLSLSLSDYQGQYTAAFHE